MVSREPIRHMASPINSKLPGTFPIPCPSHEQWLEEGRRFIRDKQLPYIAGHALSRFTSSNLTMPTIIIS
eukprot:1139412-Pelagomonas_calceolata.AAC.6